jgi:acyl-CoA thioesterase
MSSADKPRAPNLTPGPTVAGNGGANGDKSHTPNLTPVEAQRIAERAAEALFARDKTKELLGIRVISVRPGGARVGMTVRHDMVNGHHTCHGGLIFSLADSAFAAACNSHNENNVAAAASIDFLAPGLEGDELAAEASEIWRAGRTGLYEIKVTNQRGELIALFRGRSHRIGGTVTTD